MGGPKLKLACFQIRCALLPRPPLNQVPLSVVGEIHQRSSARPIRFQCCCPSIFSLFVLRADFLEIFSLARRRAVESMPSRRFPLATPDCHGCCHLVRYAQWASDSQKGADRPRLGVLGGGKYTHMTPLSGPANCL